MAPAVRAAAVSLTHYEPLQRLDVRGSGVGGNQKIAGAGPVDLSFDALGRSFQLQLSPNGGLLDAARSMAGDAIVPYRGQLAGNDDSWVRVVIADGVPSGLIWDGNQLLAIERPGDSLADADTAIIYRFADVLVEPGSMTCGAGGKPVSGEAVYKALAAELSATAAQAGVAESQINIGAVGDAEFAGIHGANAQQAILERLNNVDGIFSSQVGVQINVPLVQVFADPGAAQYPFSTSDISNTLLEELADYRSREPNQYVNGLTHLWTGKDVKSSENNNSTVGIAYTGALCSRQFGAGLSEGRNRSFDSLITAHEIGHNFGAPHDGESPCADVAGDFIMAGSLNGSDQFSQCSLDQMAADIAQAACITPLPRVDMSFALTDPVPSALLGDSATVTFSVINAGSLPATNVAADFTLPTNVSLISAAASQGSCTDGGGVVNCVLGGVEGSTAVQVVLTSGTTAVGSGFFAASVTADIDDDPSNNESGVTLTVEPAVDLSITPPSPQQIDVDETTGLTALVENTSLLDATGVTLGIALSPGLRADSASWPLGECSLGAGRIDCEAAIFGAQSNVTVSIEVTGTATGANTVDFALSSTEAEADPADNSTTAVVNVGALPEVQSSSSGGGGAVLWLLPLLGMIALRRRRFAQGLLTGPR
jgi:uncharacterized repeat protein (TIGR01451 family)/MYXO-CTERM domain-containing protein